MISIVLPTYNGARYLKQSIESIMSQSIQDWELIIIDDCSTDETLNIIHDYSKSDIRIKLVHNSVNQGLPASLNIGFSKAKGDYLTWTSDDNFYLPDALKAMTFFLNNNLSVPMVCANMYITDGNGDQLSEFRKYNPKEMYVDNYVGACFMYRREVADSIGEYDTELFGVEDYDYWLRILKRYGKIGHLDKYLYVYRMHENSLTSTKAQMIKKRHSLLLLRNFDWIIEIIKDDRMTLFNLYQHLEVTGDVSDDLRINIGMHLPEVKLIKHIDDVKPLILYGAGRICDKALKEIPHERIVYITDSAPEKYDGQKEGIPIISLEQLVKIQADYQILITVGNSLLLEVMHDLMNAGIRAYYPYNLYEEQWN